MAEVSVVMCCYNSERYIKETMDSVLNQTYKDFEFIIWNDGSTDSTKAIIESYNDPRISLFSDINRGEGMAAQLACRNASAKYIARIDSDDVWLPEKLELQYNYMEENPNVVLLSCPCIYIDKDSKELGLSFPITNIKYLNKSIFKENRIPHSGSFYRSEIYHKVGGYNNVRLFQDMLLFRKMSEYGDIAMWSYPLIKYRLLSGSVAHRVDKSRYKDIIWAFKEKIYIEKGSNDKDLELFNSIFDLIERDNIEFIYKDDMQNSLYKVLCTFIGKIPAYRILVMLKNIYYAHRFL